MKKFLLKSVSISFVLTAAATVWAGDPASGAMRTSMSTATDRSLMDRSGNPRTPRAQWVYRIVAKWGMHVQEAYRTDVHRWAESLAPLFAGARMDALQHAAEARSFDAMNDALLAGTGNAAPSKSSVPSTRSGKVMARSLGEPAKDLVYVPVTPCRILDTRVVGGPIAANSYRDFDLTDVIRFAPQGGDTSNCGVGDKGSFAAAAINFTVVTPNAAGYITAFPYLASQPTAATINYVAGDIRNGLAIIRLDQGPSAEEFTVYSYAQTHLVADIVGYFTNPEPTALECVTVSSAQVSASNVVSAVSPACPVGYTIISGTCQTSGTAYQFDSTISDTGHYCGVSKSGATVKLISHARCCRIPGR